MFHYKEHPYLDRAFMILDGETPVGEYTVLDLEEDLQLSARKLNNIVCLMNGNPDVVQLGEETQSQTYFYKKPLVEEGARAEVIFYERRTDVSKPNALLNIEGGLLE
ncbi:MAG: hypothetical protein GC136_08685 [Alphaproteobacteria bacterium]|nr:hypothetical protein [Alphaproteobacteria bacterium]